MQSGSSPVLSQAVAARTLLERVTEPLSIVSFICYRAHVQLASANRRNKQMIIHQPERRSTPTENAQLSHLGKNTSPTSRSFLGLQVTGSARMSSSVTLKVLEDDFSVKDSAHANPC